MNGLDGTDDHRLQRRIGQRREEIRMRPGRAGALELQFAHHRLTVPMDEIVLEVQPALVGQQACPHRVVGHRQHPRTHPHPPAQIGGHRGQALAAFQPARAFDVQGHVAVTQAKPGLAAQCLHRFHERPGFVVAAPAEFTVRKARQRVGDGVDIGRDRHPEMLEIVAGVDDDQQVFGRHDARQAERELGAADPAGEGNDHGESDNHGAMITETDPPAAGVSSLPPADAAPATSGRAIPRPAAPPPPDPAATRRRRRSRRRNR